MFKLSFLSLLLVSSFASAEEARRANAHVHGLNNLSMVISQNQVAISYEMPIVQLLDEHDEHDEDEHCLLYTSPSPRDRTRSRMPSSA